jgi:hypothetical protein
MFCRHDFAKNFRPYPEFDCFFQKAEECLSTKSMKSMFGDLIGNNNSKMLDRGLVSFMNVYFDIVQRKFINMDHIHNYNRIAVCNQTNKIVPRAFMENSHAISSVDFFDNYKHLIPVFRSCIGQEDSTTKILLADLGLSFVPRGIYDNYQKASFIYGRGGKGKTDFLKIIRAIHGTESCITPCQNTLGQKFSHGQFAGSLAVAYLPDEIPKKCGLSQQMFYNFVDQTPVRCELKFKQQLVTLPFQLYICWVANFFFPDFELSEALLRRVLAFDVNFFTFHKFEDAPSNLVEKYEVS